MHRMKKILIGVAFLVVSAFLVYLFIFGSTSENTVHTPTYTLLGLPESPLDATYQVEGSELLFSGGHAELKNEESGDKMTFDVTSEPIFGDINGDGQEDALLILTAQGKDTEVAYYVAVALNDDGGYLGIDSVRLEERVAPREVRIQDEMVVVTYSKNGETLTDSENQNEDSVSYTYLTLMNVTMQHFTPMNETDEVYTGNIAYEGDEVTFTSCVSGTRYSVSPNSNSLVALETIYKERTSTTEADIPMYIVLSGTFVASSDSEEDSEATEMFEVSSILSVPKDGMCRVSRVVETEPEVEIGQETVVSEENEDLETAPLQETEEISSE
jgi:hypothetical protein